MPSHLENWNFNVSHHGQYVAIASEPVCLVRTAPQYSVVPPAAPGAVNTVLENDGRKTEGWVIVVLGVLGVMYALDGPRPVSTTCV